MRTYHMAPSVRRSVTMIGLFVLAVAVAAKTIDSIVATIGVA